MRTPRQAKPLMNGKCCIWDPKDSHSETECILTTTHKNRNVCQPTTRLIEDSDRLDMTVTMSLLLKYRSSAGCCLV